MPRIIANANSASNAKDDCIITAGETFPDGAMIELVASSSGLDKPDLLLWDGSKATVGPRVEHGGRIYEAAELAPSLYRALRLPSQCRDYGSARDLLAETADLFKYRLPERESALLACFSISTWLADRLPIAPSLVISGPDEELGIDVLHLLSYVCWRSLMLAELTPSSFRSLPMELSLTLLPSQQELKPNMERLLRASIHQGLYLPGNRGSVVNPYGPKVIFCGDGAAVDALGSGVIQISLAPSLAQSSVLSDQLLCKIAADLQPRLLMYRLKNYGNVRESQVDVSELTFATGRLARTLAGGFPENSELAHDIVQLLRPQDEEIRGQRFCDVNNVTVEILWAFIHDQKQRDISVDKLAKTVNALLRSRGEMVGYRTEQIGWKLRDLNIRRHSTSSGRQVLLGRDTSQRVHQLAKDYDLRGLQIEVDCPDCDHGESALSK
jgi:hypothetical protein